MNLSSLKTAVQTNDLYANYDTKNIKLKAGCEGSIRYKYKAQDKRCVAKKIFSRFIAKCLELTIEGYTIQLVKSDNFRFMLYKYGMEEIEGALNSDKYEGLDFLKTNFTFWKPILMYKTSKYIDLRISMSKKYQKMVVDANHAKVRPNGKIYEVYDVVRIIASEYPEILVNSIRNIVNFGLSGALQCIRKGYRIKVGNRDNQIFFGMNRSSSFIKFFRIFKMRESKEMLKYTGYYYFAEGQKYMYKYPEMCQIMGSYMRDIYRLKMEPTDKLILKINEHDTTNAELIRKRTADGCPPNGSTAKHVYPLRKCCANYRSGK